MASPASSTDSAKFRRTIDASGAMSQEARDRLLKVEELQKSGKIDDAVQELLTVAAQYSTRGAPVKAVAALRQAVRMKPDSPDVRMAYGEVLTQLRMHEDAAREYAVACQQLEQAGRYGEWLEVLRRLMAMDQDNVHGHLQLAEALSRAGKMQEAAASFRALAEQLLERGETEDWEKVGERLLFHDPHDTTFAHDLALHYVRSGRHAEALGKLILCYESVPHDAELLELIIDTLEALGQPDKAAVICRELVRTYRQTGVQEEAERAMKRLLTLDPDDPEARAALGVLSGAVAQGTVIELEAGAGVPSRPHRRQTSAMQTAHPAFDADRTVAVVQPRRPSMRIPTDGLSDAAVSRPSGPVPVIEVPQARPVPQPVQAPRPAPQVAQRPMPAASAQTVAPPRPTPAPQAADAGLDWGDAPTRRPAQAPAAPTNAPAAPANALDALLDAHDEELPAENSWPDDDDEAGFDVDDRTIVQDQLPHDLLVRMGLESGPSPAPAADEPVASTRRRSNSLPRPRLARRVGTMTELPTTVREMSKDLSTLDFFIDGGYQEAALALLDALHKRHPDHPDLAGYRARIERMSRG